MLMTSDGPIIDLRDIADASLRCDNVREVNELATAALAGMGCEGAGL